MRIPIYQIDAFTSTPFHGNPAAVCPLEQWPDDAILQAIAAENNLAETAFLVPIEPGYYHLRWFTPTVEMPLCGHATLAAAYAIDHKMHSAGDRLRFRTASGDLLVTRDGDRYTLDFPARPPQPSPPRPDFAAALGATPQDHFTGPYEMAVFASEAEIRALQPDFRALAAIPHVAIIATAPGDDVDFVSRFFAPNAGIDEDPVTGSAHCTLTPYWTERLGKTSLHAKQLSKRGGELWCECKGDRVLMSGQGVFYLEGSIEVPDSL
jgi:PhzF family phenazine biosynthesis protein